MSVAPERRPTMPDDLRRDLYDHDILLWSEQQAGRLRALRDRLPRVNDPEAAGVDWDHVIEEIEDVGRAELHSVEGHLAQALAHLMKVAAWPEALAAGHWRAEAASQLNQARKRFAPSMRQRIDLAEPHRGALRILRAQGTVDGKAPRPIVEACPLTLDALLDGDLDIASAAERFLTT